MKRKDRCEWILKKMKSCSYYSNVDITFNDFVEEYIEECKPTKIGYQPYGANIVPQLNKDLAYMYKQGVLDRYVCGLGDMHSLGFPKWVYIYNVLEERLDE